MTTVVITSTSAGNITPRTDTKFLASDEDYMAVVQRFNMFKNTYHIAYTYSCVVTSSGLDRPL